MWGYRIPHGKRHFGEGAILVMLRLARGNNIFNSIPKEAAAMQSLAISLLYQLVICGLSNRRAAMDKIVKLTWRARRAVPLPDRIA